MQVQTSISPTSRWELVCVPVHPVRISARGMPSNKPCFERKSIGIQSTSATYLKTKVFPQLGIADALADKLSGAGAAEVASGGVEMVVLPVSEILPVRGVDLVGTIPADLQFVQVFTAAVVKGTKDP